MTASWPILKNPAINLCPLAGMKLQALKGDERRFEKSDRLKKVLTFKKSKPISLGKQRINRKNYLKALDKKFKDNSYTTEELNHGKRK